MRAIQASPDPLVLTRERGHVVVEASDAFLALIGRDREESLGRSASELGLEPLLDAAAGGDAREIAFHLPGREPLTLRVSSVAFDHGGERYLVTVARDVTQELRLAEALRRSEERFRGMFERAQEGLFRTDLDGRIVAANPALARIAGYRDVADLLRRAPNVRDICPDPERGAELLRALEASGHVEGFEVELRRADGTTAWLSLNVHTVPDEHGRTVAREGSVVDVTAAKLLELERTRLAAEIVRALEAERAAIAEGRPRRSRPEDDRRRPAPGDAPGRARGHRARARPRPAEPGRPHRDRPASGGSSSTSTPPSSSRVASRRPSATWCARRTSGPSRSSCATRSSGSRRRRSRSCSTASPERPW
ncbi:MAG: hypothetical protein KatS3mg014_2621 [Actinomycetota bacterium]|nr:MAG: hypothetical protein KatS3mg014_2621 [Actinomycetota bacterium]